MLDCVALADKAKARVDELSGAMTRRLVIVRSLQGNLRQEAMRRVCFR